jgi:hypothetical protein
MSYYILAEPPNKTLIDTLSVVVAALALLIALLGYLLARKSDKRSAESNKRSAENEKETAALKKSEFRREFFEKVQELAFLVTQRGIVISQTQSAHQEMLAVISAIPSRLQRNELKNLRAALDAATKAVGGDADSNKKMEDVLDQMWDLKTISQQIFEDVQNACAFTKGALEKQRTSLAEILKSYEGARAAIQALVSKPPE